MPGVRELAVVYRETLAAFDEEAFSGEECAQIVEELALTRKAAEAAEARAAVRAGKCGAYRTRGFAGTLDWLASTTGSSFRDAREAVATIGAVAKVPETRDALFEGNVSMEQAAEIARTEAQVPGTEAELLELAKVSSLSRVRERARKRRTEAMDPDDLAEAQHLARDAGHWRDYELGMFRLSAAFTPEVGSPIMKRWDVETDRLYRDARKRGEFPTRRRCAADALAAMLTGSGLGFARAAEVVFVCDYDAVVRGHAHPGEVCSIVGGGPVPVSTVMAAARDAFIKAVLHDGTAIQHVVHYGRRPNALQRTVLMLGAPPDFAGTQCSYPGCDRRYGLEYDHVDPVANGGSTTLDNLELPCREHHHQKTERDRTAGLLGGNRKRYRLERNVQEVVSKPGERGPPLP